MGIAYLSSTAFSNSLYYEAVLGPARFAVRDAVCFDWFIVASGPLQENPEVILNLSTAAALDRES